MKMTRSRSVCPIGLTLDIVGDKWSLLIVRDLLFADKKTYKELAESPEKIATNILAERLERLEHSGLIRKLSDEHDRRKYIYALTEKGIDIMPVLLEMIAWGMKYNPEADYPQSVVTHVARDKEGLIAQARQVELAR